MPSPEILVCGRHYFSGPSRFWRFSAETLAAIAIVEGWCEEVFRIVRCHSSLTREVLADTVSDCTTWARRLYDERRPLVPSLPSEEQEATPCHSASSPH